LENANCTARAERLGRPLPEDFFLLYAGELPVVARTGRDIGPTIAERAESAGQIARIWA